MLLPLATFAPDASPEAPGLRSATGWVPTVRGTLATAPEANEQSYGALAAACYGAGTIVTLAGANEVYAGTASNLYKVSAGAWSSVGSGYSLSGEQTWYFSSLENSRLAASIDNKIQRSTGSSFADITASPQCSIVEPVGLFAVAFDIVDGGWGTYPDGWWCCKQSDVTNWDTTDVSTQSVRGRLYATPGPVKAARALGPQMIVYKETGVYVGTYQGPPKVFGWELAQGNGGCVGKFAIATVFPSGRPAHFVVGPRDLFLFDGNAPQPIGIGEVSKWFFANLHPSYTGRTSVVVDYATKNVKILFANNQSSGVLNDSLVWNYQTGKWGRGRDYNAVFGLQFVAPTQTFDDLTSTTFDDLTSSTFDALSGGSGVLAASVITDGDKLATLNKPTSPTTRSELTTGSYGDDETVSLVERIRPRFVTPPQTEAILRHWTADEVNGNTDPGEWVLWENRRFDLLAEARWHSDQMHVRGYAEVEGLSITVGPVSGE